MQKPRRTACCVLPVGSSVQSQSERFTSTERTSTPSCYCPACSSRHKERDTFSGRRKVLWSTTAAGFTTERAKCQRISWRLTTPRFARRAGASTALIWPREAFSDQHGADILTPHGQDRAQPAIVTAWRTLDRPSATRTRHPLQIDAASCNELTQAEGRAVAQLPFRRALRPVGLRRVEADQAIRLPFDTNRVAVHDLDRADRVGWRAREGLGLRAQERFGTCLCIQE